MALPGTVHLPEGGCILYAHPQDTLFLLVWSLLHTTLFLNLSIFPARLSIPQRQDYVYRVHICLANNEVPYIHSQ